MIHERQKPLVRIIVRSEVEKWLSSFSKLGWVS